MQKMIFIKSNHDLRHDFFYVKDLNKQDCIIKLVEKTEPVFCISAFCATPSP